MSQLVHARTHQEKVPMKNLDPLYAEKSSIVKELFVATADDNYINARWCFHNELNVDFFWLALHAVEKYLKASLLINGKSAKGYSHNIVKLFSDVRNLAPELIPTDLQKPDDSMPSHYWHAETSQEYIKRLNRNGDADNRYQIYGYSRQAEDLWKLDQIVFSIRRLCQPLEVHFLNKPRAGFPDQTRRERMLLDASTSWNLQCRIEETIQGRRGSEVRDALLNWNFPFLRGQSFDHKEQSYTWSSQEPVLVKRLFDPLERGPESYSESDALWQWTKDNVQLPSKLVSEIEVTRSQIKQKHSQPPS